MREIKKIGYGKTGRCGPALRIVANQLLTPARRRHRRAGIRRQKADHVPHRQLAGEIHGGAEMPGIADTDRGDAIFPSPLKRQIDRLLRDPLAYSVAAVKRQQRAGIADDAWCRVEAGRAAVDPRAIPEGAHHAMRGMSPQIGRYKRIGKMRRRIGRHIHRQIDIGNEVAQSVRVNPWHGHSCLQDRVMMPV